MGISGRTSSGQILRNPLGLYQYLAGKGNFSSASGQLMGQPEDGKHMEQVERVIPWLKLILLQENSEEGLRAWRKRVGSLAHPCQQESVAAWCGTRTREHCLGSHSHVKIPFLCSCPQVKSCGNFQSPEQWQELQTRRLGHSKVKEAARLVDRQALEHD